MWFYIGLPNSVRIRRWTTASWRHIDYSRWRPQRRKSTSGFRFGVTSHIQEGRKLFAYQSMAEILLLPVSENKRPPYWNSVAGFHSDLSLSVACDSALGYQTSFESDHPQHGYDVNMAAVSHDGFALGDGRPPTKCTDGRCYILTNFCFIRFIVSEIVRLIHTYIGVLIWNCLFTQFFGGFGGLFLPNDVLHYPNPQKDPLARKHVVWAIKRENRSNGSTWAQDREKRTRQDRTGQSKKSQRRYISPIWGEAPTEPIFTEEFTCAKFRTAIIRGCDFTGVEFSNFFYWFLDNLSAAWHCPK